MAHILTLSSAAIGLFKRAILMSGSAIRSFYSMAPGYADTVRTTFLAHLGVTATDPEEIFHRLVKTSIEDIIEANREVQDLFGTLSFTPVVESKQVGVTRILDDDPEILSYEGRGRDIALMIGFTTDECELFRHRLEELQALESVHNHPVLVTPPSLAFTRPPEVLNMIVQKIKKEYLKEMSMNNYVKLCSDMSFEYPALKSAEIRAQAGGQNVYLYQFSYESDLSYIKRLKDLHYKGVGHLEDLTYLFNATGGECAGCGHKPKFVSIEEVLRDELMKDWMGTLVSNFVKYSTPVKDPQFWPSVSTHNYQYQDIKVPKKYHVSQLTQRQFHLMQFHDSLHNIR